MEYDVGRISQACVTLLDRLRVSLDNSLELESVSNGQQSNQRNT